MRSKAQPRPSSGSMAPTRQTPNRSIGRLISKDPSQLLSDPIPHAWSNIPLWNDPAMYGRTRNQLRFPSWRPDRVPEPFQGCSTTPVDDSRRTWRPRDSHDTKGNEHPDGQAYPAHSADQRSHDCVLPLIARRRPRGDPWQTMWLTHCAATVVEEGDPNARGSLGFRRKSIPRSIAVPSNSMNWNACSHWLEQSHSQFRQHRFHS